MLETIPNLYPLLTTRVTLTHPFARLCPLSGEPQPASTLSITYQAGVLLLETKSLRRYLESFAGENAYGVRDLEAAAQLIAQACAELLAVPVAVRAQYVLAVGTIEVEITATPPAPGAP